MTDYNNQTLVARISKFRALTDASLSFEASVEAVLKFGCELFGARAGIVTVIENSQQRVIHCFSLNGEYTQGQLIEFEELAAANNLFESIETLSSDGLVEMGALVFHGLDANIDDDLSAVDDAMLQLMTDWVRREIEKSNAKQRLDKAMSALRRTRDYTGVITWELDLIKRKWLWSTDINSAAAGDWYYKSIEDVMAAVHPDHRQKLEDAIRKSIEDKSSYELEYQGYIDTGELRWFQSKAEVQYDEAGNAQAVLGVLQDISDRK